MTQLEMEIAMEEGPYGAANIPGVLIKGLNRKRAQARYPRSLPQARKAVKKAGEGQADVLLLW